MLSVWDEQLAAVATSILKKRIEFVSECGKLLAGLYRRIESGNSELGWAYETPVDVSGELRVSLLEKLRSARRRDLNIGATSVGPHRDDVSISLNGTVMRSFASQGEAKSAALAIKLAIFEFLKTRLGEAPILLLDELSSQLDAARVSSLLAMLPEFGQVFLTTTRGAELRKGLSIQAEMRFEVGRLVDVG
jgi:DNA replication and repair protein RecF